MKYKYIMFEADGIKLPIVFPEYLVHKYVAGNLMPQMRSLFTSTKVISAGFYDFETHKCYGESESLKLSSNPEDSEIIGK